MSDNRRRDNHEECREEPREEKKNDGGKLSSALTGLWNTTLGKVLFYCGLNYILPTDKILEQVAMPGAAAAESLLNLGKIKLVQEPLDWLKRQAVKTLLIGATVFFVSLILALYGIKWCNGYVVAAAGGIWTAYLLYVLTQIRIVGKTVAALASFGLELTKSALGRLLQAVGIARPEGDGLSIDAKDVDEVAKTLQYVIAVSLAATFILSVAAFASTTPPWLPVGLFLFGAVAALAAVSLSSIKELEIKTAPTWRGLNKCMAYAAIAAIVFGVVLAVLPSFRQKIVGAHVAVNAWITNPGTHLHLWMLIPLAAFICALGRIMAAYYGKAEAQKSAAWRTVATVAGWAIAVVIGAMMWTGNLNCAHFQGAYHRFKGSSSVAASAPAKVKTVSTPLVVAPTGTAGSSEEEPPSPAPAPDFTGQTPRQILEKYLK